MNRRIDELICVGHIIGVQGLKGWVKIFSHTSPRDNIISYSPWLIENGEELTAMSIEGRVQGKHIIAKLEGIESRDAAEAMIGRKFYIEPAQLPELESGEYYWSDLIGLEVQSLQSEPLGTVASMLETGANDVMVLSGDRERLIPFVFGEIVSEVDLKNRRIVVDWLPEY